MEGTVRGGSDGIGKDDGEFCEEACVRFRLGIDDDLEALLCPCRR